jgi:hypothetical protein
MRDVISAYIQEPARTVRVKGPIKIQAGLSLASIDVDPPTVYSGDAARIDVEFDATGPGVLFECAVLVFTRRGDRVAVLDPRDSGRFPLSFDRGRVKIAIDISQLPLVEGDYTIGLAVRADVAWDEFADLTDFKVARRTSLNPGQIAPEWRGLVELDSSTLVETEPCVS